MFSDLGTARLSRGEERRDRGVTGTVVIPKDVASFTGRTLEIRLYKIHPKLADAPATLVEKLEAKDFAHTKGTETKKDIALGANEKLDPRLRYYMTLFVLDGNVRTHMGEADHAKNNLCNVLTEGQPRKIVVTFKELKR